MTQPAPPHGFDAHTHLDYPAFDLDRDAVCRRARAAGIQRWIIAGAHPDHWLRVLACAKETKGYAVLGIHPWYVDTLTEEALMAALKTLDSAPSPYGLGELGLDYARAKTQAARLKQQRFLREQIAIAARHDLPLILHAVRALHDLTRILKTEGIPARGGMIHSWSGSPEQAVQVLQMGLHISFSSLVFRSPKVAATARLVPPERLLIETDSPDQPLRPGERNEPAALRNIAEYIGSLRDESTTTILNLTHANAVRLFGLEG